MAEIRAVELTVIAALMASFSVAALGQGSAPVVVPDLTLPAFAQEKISVIDRAHPEYDEVGYQFGPYILKPTISAAESVDSNILGSSSFERSDFITTIKPTISLDSDWASDAVGFYAEGDVAQYARYTSENVGNIIVRGDGRWDIDRGQTLAINAGYQVQHEDRYSPESQAAVSQAGGGTYAKYPTEYSLTNGGLTYVYSPSRLGFEVQATVNKYDYTNEPTLNGGLAIENDRSRVEYAITPRVSYELIPGYQAFIEGWANRHEYDSTFDATPRASETQLNRLCGSDRHTDQFGGFANRRGLCRISKPRLRRSTALYEFRCLFGCFRFMECDRPYIPAIHGVTKCPGNNIGWQLRVLGYGIERDG